MSHHKMIIIGAGAAGYSAAIYAARGGIVPLIITGTTPGGQLTIAHEVENYPGYASINGVDLTFQMMEQAESFGTIIEYETVIDVDIDKHPFVLTTEKKQYTCDALVIATGATARWLGVDGEAELMGKGVSACATCDGFFFKDKDVIVVGGGNTAVEESLHLSKICKTVTLIHRGDKLRAEAILQDRLQKKSNVSFIWNHTLSKILKNKDSEMVGSVILNSNVDNSSLSLDTDAVFVAIGHDPVTDLFKGKLALFSGGYIKTVDKTTKTSVEGVFAAGDVADPVYRQAVTAAGMGCMAALDVEKWLAK